MADSKAGTEKTNLEHPILPSNKEALKIWWEMLKGYRSQPYEGPTGWILENLIKKNTDGKGTQQMSPHQYN